MFPSLHTPPAHDVMIFTAINSTAVGNLRHNHIGRIIILILIVTDNLNEHEQINTNEIKATPKLLQNYFNFLITSTFLLLFNVLYCYVMCSYTVQSNILIIILLVFTDSTGGNNSNSN